MPTPPILNISCYRFVPLDDVVTLQSALLQQAQQRCLKGTILLASEGINMFVAGLAEDVRGFVAWLEIDSRFAGLSPKESWSDSQPFGKLKVKLKSEIIRMNHPTIRPALARAPAVQASTLKRWLDAGVDDTGRPVVLLDTRNQFEVDAGSFVEALHWNLQKFSEFPQAARAQQASLQNKTVVSFCTGGIRCEKAAIYLREIGLPHVYQLEGGILKYFEEVGQSHYQGSCFVFDERGGLLPDLSPQRSHPTTARGS